MCLDGIHMSTEFRSPTINWEAGLAVSNIPGGAVEPFGHAHFRHPLIIKFFTGTDVSAEYQEFSCMFRPPKRGLFRVKKERKKN